MMETTVWDFVVSNPIEGTVAFCFVVYSSRVVLVKLIEMIQSSIKKV